MLDRFQDLGSIIRSLTEASISKPAVAEQDFDYNRAIAFDRACQNAGVIQFLVDQGLIEKKNLGGKAVDLGTGYGNGVLALDFFGAEEVVGVAKSSESWDGRPILRERYIELSASQYLSQVETESIDFISAFWCNMKFRDFYDEALRVLRLGGQLLVTTDIPDTIRPEENKQAPWMQLPCDTIRADFEQFLQGKHTFVPENNNYRDGNYLVVTKNNNGNIS